jgi:tetratricopeptide (TPR) repeat protein
MVVSLVSVGLGAGPVAAQAPSAEALYEAGALRVAADSFARRAAAAPGVAAHWYNLGAAWYRAGADGKAIAAWTRAARLAPRHGVIAAARRLLPAPDAASERLLAVGLATPVEWGLAAAAAWSLAWLVVLMRRRRLAWMVLGGVALALAVQAGLAWRRASIPLAVVAENATAVRVAPYGSAAPSATLDAGAAVVVARARGPWLEVWRDDGVRGWMLAAEVARL